MPSAVEISPPLPQALPREAAHPTRLSELAVGDRGVITEVGGGRAFRRRLLELGLVPGTELQLTNVAPLGDPLELRVRGTRMSIRRAEARVIALAPTPDARERSRRRLKVAR